MDELKQLHDGIIEGKAKPVRAATEAALAAGVDPNTLLNQYMIPAMDIVGQKYEAGEYFVPELLMAARAMKGSLELLRPLLAASGVAPVARVAIGTVKGDLHDIGKNLVAAMLEGGGFEVVDLGTDVPVEKFVNAITEHRVSIIALSALLTTTMSSMKAVVEAVKSAGLQSQAKVIIGGAPITERFASEIGADGYSANASGAVALARRLTGLP
jgi:5-methyltetrahydrofolate--homocysteine methyltransferase